jgi:hypothetical protein
MFAKKEALVVSEVEAFCDRARQIFSVKFWALLNPGMKPIVLLFKAISSQLLAKS